MVRSVGIVGGGIAGLAAAYELERQRASRNLTYTLVEASNRLGGIVETHREQGFVIECGPDGWVTEKPWARELAEELGLGDELIPSNDATRVTWVLQGGHLLPVPDGMRMMVPEALEPVMHSPLFSPAARAAYAAEPARAAELKARVPHKDESVASFVERHFGSEVLRVIGAPLLGGVFGGDVHRLSVRAVMPAFVRMEREHGSLILAMQARAAQLGNTPRPSTFTSLRSGTGTLAERIVETLSPNSIQLNTYVSAMQRTGSGWLLTYSNGEQATFDHVLLATPVRQTRELLHQTDACASERLNIDSSSAVIAGFGFTAGKVPVLPNGFGFLAPEGEGCALLAGTFADQKFAGRVPTRGKSLRAYFGGDTANMLMSYSDEGIAAAARRELEKVLGPVPVAAVTVVRRWPDALPQYEVGHMERMAELQEEVSAGGALHLLGNGYRGVGLPDLIRDARMAAREACA